MVNRFFRAWISSLNWSAKEANPGRNSNGSSIKQRTQCVHTCASVFMCCQLKGGARHFSGGINVHCVKWNLSPLRAKANHSAAGFQQSQLPWHQSQFHKWPHTLPLNLYRWATAKTGHVFCPAQPHKMACQPGKPPALWELVDQAEESLFSKIGTTLRWNPRGGYPFPEWKQVLFIQ